ncbi:restriction endonuclease subunit S [Clostridium sp. AF23-8]|nr:restriction endonuclease subunit S [Clostridium sp. AF23-8]
MNCKKRKGNHKFGFGGMMEMEDIKRVQLSEIVELITKGTTPTTLGYEFQDEGVNFFKIECFDENGGFIESKVAHISEECHKKMKRSQLKNGDILFSIAGAIGRVAIVTEEMLPANINQALAIIRISDEQVYLPYIKLILTSPIVIEQFERKKQGVAQLNLSLKDINEISIPLPGKDKQIELAELFDKVVGVISKRNKELSVLDDLIKARFVEMFNLSDCIYKSLGECTDFVDYRGHTPELSDEGIIRMVNAKSVGKGFFKYVDEFVTEETYDAWMHRGFGYPGDILFVTEGHTFGNTCLIPEDMTKFALGQRVITIKGKEEIKNAFLCSYMQTDMFWKDINVYRTGGTAQGIRSKDLVKVMVPIPPIEQQIEFVRFVHKVDKSKVAVQKALDETQLLFDSLMQKYFG